MFFRDLFMGETAAPDVSGECGGGKPARHREPLRRGGRDSPVNKSLKKPAREPRNERKDFMTFPYASSNYFVLLIVCLSV
jgi:hypothetical protein